MNLLKNAAMLGLSLGMLAYAVPRLHAGEGLTAGSVFAVVWICLALVIVSAHLHTALGVGERTKERLRQVKRMRSWQRERDWQRRTRAYGMRK
ncbi:MAG: hypothetical protein J7639_30300 [Paenibacillaceae bacterium]|nr:hypothetical protein [Paenibacillaceae bacterium]